MKNRQLFFLVVLFAVFTLSIFASTVASAGTIPGAPVGVSSLAVPATPTPYKLFLPFIVKPGYNTLWRFGAGKVQSQSIANYYPTINGFRLGWYTDYQATPNAPEPNGIEYVFTVRVKQWKKDPNTLQPTSAPCYHCEYVTPYTYTVVSPPSLSIIHDMALAQQGKTWLVGNEMERTDWANGSKGGQDEIVPELYGQAYHDIYFTIKNADPSAQVAIGGMIQATPLRLKYLDRVWNSYSLTYTIPMTVDIWNIHGFVLQEKSCWVYPPGQCYGAEIPAGLTETVGVTYPDPYPYNYTANFTNVIPNIQALRSWMKNHAEQNKPLYVSEYGVLYPWFSADQIKNNFMYPSFDYFMNYISPTLGYSADGNRLVQRLNWYSLDDDSTDGSGHQNLNGNLIYSGLSQPTGSGNPLGITTLGSYWQSKVQTFGAGSGKPY